MIKISIGERFKVQRFMIRTDSDSIYELIHQKSLFLGKSNFYCKLVKGKTPGMSKKLIKVDGLMLGAKLNRKNKLELKLENLKPGITIWMEDKSHTSIVRVIKKF